MHVQGVRLRLERLPAGLADVRQVGGKVRKDRRHAVHGHEQAGLGRELHPEHVSLLQGCAPVDGAAAALRAQSLIALPSPRDGLHLARAGGPPAAPATVQQAVAVGREVANSLPSGAGGKHLRAVEAETHDELGLAVETDLEGVPEAPGPRKRPAADQQLCGLACAGLLDDRRLKGLTRTAPRSKVWTVSDKPFELRPPVVELEASQPEPQPLMKRKAEPLLQAHPPEPQQSLCTEERHAHEPPQLSFLVFGAEAARRPARSVALQEAEDRLLGLHL
mmetsp:Transcript_33977/g.105559  ORF Transcript_33977/g.105559 Transcript_33977/m.105559 type:complete len:277 (+) Transcript_33977:1573-2403(+)